MRANRLPIAINPPSSSPVRAKRNVLQMYLHANTLNSSFDPNSRIQSKARGRIAKRVRYRSYCRVPDNALSPPGDIVSVP
jgi:hypothetical protein